MFRPRPAARRSPSPPPRSPRPPSRLAGSPGIAWAQATPAVPDMTIGKDDAPVTMVEYAMFTCPHCAVFNQEVLPKIKANYIDTGKVKLVFREVYFNKPEPVGGDDRPLRAGRALLRHRRPDLPAPQIDWAAATDEET